MVTHTLECSEPYFSQVRRGEKTVEGRKGTTRWDKIKEGDIVIFDDEKGHTFRTKAIKINRYPDIRSYLESETLERALPGVKTIEEGIAVYLQWSTEDEVFLHGFLGITIEVL